MGQLGVKSSSDRRVLLANNQHMSPFNSFCGAKLRGVADSPAGCDEGLGAEESREEGLVEGSGADAEVIKDLRARETI